MRQIHRRLHTRRVHDLIGGEALCNIVVGELGDGDMVTPQREFPSRTRRSVPPSAFRSP